GREQEGGPHLARGPGPRRERRRAGLSSSRGRRRIGTLWVSRIELGHAARRARDPACIVRGRAPDGPWGRPRGPLRSAGGGGAGAGRVACIGRRCAPLMLRVGRRGRNGHLLLAERSGSISSAPVPGKVLLDAPWLNR